MPTHTNNSAKYSFYFKAELQLKSDTCHIDVADAYQRFRLHISHLYQPQVRYARTMKEAWLLLGKELLFLSAPNE